MSYPTRPAYIHTGSFSSVSDEVPPFKWMRQYTSAFDSAKIGGEWDHWHTSDFQYAKGDGQIFAKGTESRDKLLQDYSLFTKYRHQPYYAVVYKRQEDDGWELSGNAYLFANLPGGSGSGSQTDDEGTGWEIKIPAGFHFVFQANGDSFKLSSTAITSDSGPVVMELLKRGVMKPADLGL